MITVERAVRVAVPGPILFDTARRVSEQNYDLAFRNLKRLRYVDGNVVV